MLSYAIIPVVLVIFLAALILFRTLRLHRIPEPVQAAEKPKISKDEISRHLSQLIGFKSISGIGAAQADLQPFLDIHAWIDKTFPHVAGQLKKTVINKYSLLYTWQGSDPSLAPVLLNAHLDVVPVEESTLPAWKVDPFGGVIREGYVWGRGALDMKSQAIGLLDAVESLIRDGYTPRRTIYLAFGHDEEIMGFQGSLKIVEHLKANGVKLAAVLDEGGMITVGAIAGVNDPYAMIGISEKGYLTLKVSAQGKPGHSSRPPRQTAIGIVARAIALLDDHPLPSRLDYFLPTLEKISFLLPAGMKMVIGNSWLFKRALINKLEKTPVMNAMIRTTHAATVISGGIKDNVLPASAIAKINLRLLPGDSIDSVIRHITRVVADPRVEIKVDEVDGGWEASRVSPVDTPAYLSLELVTRQIFGGVPVAPFVFLAATDSRHYQPICKNIYKFTPLVITPAEQDGIHGVNERISQDSLVNMAAFYMRLMRVWGDAGF